MSKVKSYYGGSTSHYYTYNGSTLVQEKIVTSGSQTTEYLTFLYNSEGPTGFVYNNTLYTYRKNIFGDIIAVYNGTSKVAEYAYDAYGNCRVITGSNIGTLNPFRYRGYYFDEDMKLYYLQSRYYDPKTGRFINADDVSYLDPETIHGLNLYTYCLNNPVMDVDPTGHFVISTLIVGALIGAVVGAVTSTISQGLAKGWENINGWQVLLDATIGGISGALGASGITRAVSMIAGGVLGAAGSIGGDLITSGGDWSKVNIGKAIGMGILGVVLGRWTGHGTQNTHFRNIDINTGKTWGSKAFLISAEEALLRPNSGLTLQTMYMNMAKAITLHSVQGMLKVSIAILASTSLGNFIGA